MDGAPFDFSFSGIKSSVLNYLNHAKMRGETVNSADLAASFQHAVVEVLVEHAISAVKQYGFLISLQWLVALRLIQLFELQ